MSPPVPTPSNPPFVDRPFAEVARLLRPFLPWLALSVVTGIAAGAATVALLGTINQVLNRSGGMAGGLLLTFVSLCAVALVGRVTSDMSTNRVGQRLVAQVRKSLAQKILSAPIDALERYRTHRLMPVLTQDVDMISDAGFVLASTVIALSIALGCLGYLAWLSLPMFGLLVVALAVGAAVQAVVLTRAEAGFWRARDGEEQLHQAYRGISEGAKELRMHRGRRARMMSGQIERTVDGIRAVNQRAINTYVVGSAFGSALFFLLIAVILGWAAASTVAPAVLSGFVLVLLFLKGPIDQLVGVLPNVGRAKVAFQRIGDLSLRFATPEPHLHLDRPAGELAFTDAIELRGVRYAFDAPEGGGEPFELGPVDLVLRRGELVFIVGDNGSGKTTLIKLLLGLYAPQQGELRLDGQPVTDATRDDYRQLFTTVFSDFYLFQDLLAGEGGAPLPLPEAARPYLERLEIAHKVSVRDGAFTTTDLSTGQRKRLALVHAWLEGRPVLVFDEWAADQDPAFRHLFYTELLPELRAKGHLVVVISHDDRYFHVADRVVRMAAGKVERPVKESAEAIAA
ncbi:MULTISPECIES: cyclic peptide export ABC transporter [unclassified Rhizobacter]|uniref:cyclic peptide export ABC transporter n=1 Tax=unclassified Rhizobacter TaxID=2640088 RepID=UPI0006F9FFDB|nr:MULTISPECIES: cyclic peptide export ABC transporter [unclassified Rhizobacter]KQU75665.1 cyclic peptide transporter [Rhizobacter sp. Root29]KQW07393.1 cyclic peptide transporter [Rhizobacter sp. Root1238]KRB18048.1 cyclic peptide transporter [Rhizobacter sp. Root16D2]